MCHNKWNLNLHVGVHAAVWCDAQAGMHHCGVGYCCTLAVHSAMGVNVNGAHMHARVYIIAVYAYIRIMYMAQCGCIWCALHNADYATVGPNPYSLCRLGNISEFS